MLDYVRTREHAGRFEQSEPCPTGEQGTAGTCRIGRRVASHIQYQRAHGLPLHPTSSHGLLYCLSFDNRTVISTRGLAPLVHREESRLSHRLPTEDESVPLSLTSAGGQDEKKSLPHKKM